MRWGTFDLKWEMNLPDSVVERDLRKPGGEWIGPGRGPGGCRETGDELAPTNDLRMV